MPGEIEEIVELLWASAREGSVTAQKALLEHYKQLGDADADDDFEALDELAPRRRAKAS